MTADKKPEEGKIRTKEEIEAAVDKRINKATGRIMSLVGEALKKHQGL